MRIELTRAGRKHASLPLTYIRIIYYYRSMEALFILSYMTALWVAYKTYWLIIAEKLHIPERLRSMPFGSMF